jgi:RNA polymerase sigma factor (sigma-70 family)
MAVEAMQSLQWLEIYKRIKRDPNDLQAFTCLKNRIDRWAKRDFWKHGGLWIDDVVADTCFAVVEHIHDAFGEKTFCAFVVGHYWNVRRRFFKEVQYNIENIPVEEVDPANPPADPEEDRSLAYLLDCIDRLAERERIAINMRWRDEQPYEEVARTLKVKSGNARRIVFNAIQMLGKCIQNKRAQA